MRESRSAPEFDETDGVRRKRSGWLAISFALLFCLLVYGVLSFLTLGFFGPILVVGGVLLGVVGFHYFVWGWWLEKYLRDAADDDEPNV